MYLGFDRSQYPGDEVMASLWASTPLYFVAPYLAPAPSHGDAAWMRAIPTLRDMGWGFAPVYVGQQSPGGPGSHVLTAAQGVVDAEQAARLAAGVGFPTQSVIYLDIEIGGDLPPAHLAYVEAWVAHVKEQTDYWAGVYCSFSHTAAQVNRVCGTLPTWVFHPRGGPDVVDLALEVAPDPSTSGFADALAWQYRLSLGAPVDLEWTDNETGNRRRLHQVDLDSALLKDPSWPSWLTGAADAPEAAAPTEVAR